MRREQGDQKQNVERILNGNFQATEQAVLHECLNYTVQMLKMVVRLSSDKLWPVLHCEASWPKR
jgi:hypothetical protein